jgi:tetratricopeptide (TPR) repeat protein
MRRTLSLFAATAIVVAGSYAVRSPARDAAVAAPVAGTDVGTDAIGGGADGPELDRLIAAFETQVADRPNALGLTFLGRLYLQRAKLTGDAATYAQALRALGDAVRRSPRDAEANDLLAGARYSTHDFRGARDLAARVLASTPSDTAALAVVGDSALELGDDATAAQVYARLAAALPGSPAVLARQSRLAFLRGDVAMARSLAAQATAASARHGDFGTTRAFYSVLAGRLDLDSGRYAASVRHYRDALATAPGWHVALAGLARATAATGHPRTAIALYRRAVDVVPQPDYLAALGDLQLLAGRRAEAARTYGTVGVVARLSALNHRLYDRLIASYDADHGIDTANAVRIAEASLRHRADVYGYDVLAWSLYRAGRYDEAARASDRALALGTPDATLLYHAGLVAAARNDVPRARALLSRALAISPAFDPLQAPRARAALAGLR